MTQFFALHSEVQLWRNWLDCTYSGGAANFVREGILHSLPFFMSVSLFVLSLFINFLRFLFSSSFFAYLSGSFLFLCLCLFYSFFPSLILSLYVFLFISLPFLLSFFVYFILSSLPTVFRCLFYSFSCLSYLFLSHFPYSLFFLYSLNPFFLISTIN